SPPVGTESRTESIEIHPNPAILLARISAKSGLQVRVSFSIAARPRPLTEFSRPLATASGARLRPCGSSPPSFKRDYSHQVRFPTRVTPFYPKTALHANPSRRKRSN